MGFIDAEIFDPTPTGTVQSDIKDEEISCLK